MVTQCSRTMKAWLAYLAFWTVVIAAANLVPGAGGSACELIRDADRRHLCRATTGNRPAECEFIHDSDLRQECRAKTGK